MREQTRTGWLDRMEEKVGKFQKFTAKYDKAMSALFQDLRKAPIKTLKEEWFFWKALAKRLWSR